MGAEVLVPPKSKRIIQREYDKAPCIMSITLLKDYSNKLKNFRRIATRYDKTAAAFMG
jgi:putative transposase